MIYFLVGIGGIVGALLRFVSSQAFPTLLFPTATLFINLTGSFILAWLTTYVSKVHLLPPALVTALGTGLIGAFTTFSTFSVETVKLISSHHYFMAAMYLLCSLWGGLLCSWLGFRFGHYCYSKYTVGAKG
ncbi:camphor resistance protein CrcB [Fictibacillus macauensis ZFHKF-1]|uniref:Fluoride-specific ion channel FluC n=1 Tax=Fictibacillus macauensis ZFHKF-1 TaxID=1196324 RepID=I8IZ64_9BACL|nr:fluoride efflux transporter CrcB [Fictibacillus macauensis]EIT84781.1 camphor resistance protein CrcB [Fictibacillus macauensis ZFHKF-1]